MIVHPDCRRFPTTVAVVEQGSSCRICERSLPTRTHLISSSRKSGGSRRPRTDFGQAMKSMMCPCSCRSWFPRPICRLCRIMDFGNIQPNAIFNNRRALEGFVNLLSKFDHEQWHWILKQRSTSHCPHRGFRVEKCRSIPRARKRSALANAMTSLQSRAERSSEAYTSMLRPIIADTGLHEYPRARSPADRVVLIGQRKTTTGLHQHLEIVKGRFQTLLWWDSWSALLDSAERRLIDRENRRNETRKQAATREYKKALGDGAHWDGKLVERSITLGRRYFAVIRELGLSGLAMIGDDCEHR